MSNINKIIEEQKEEFEKEYIMKNYCIYNKKLDIPATTTEMIYLYKQNLKQILESEIERKTNKINY